jgi:amphi-Trp domain-containing protein
MSDVEVKREGQLTRGEAASQLAALAAALADGEKVELTLGDSTLKMRVPNTVHCEVELEIDDDEVELEVELKWKRTPAAKSAPTSAAVRRAAPANRRARAAKH